MLSIYARLFAGKGYGVFIAAPGKRTTAISLFGSGIRFIPMYRQSGKFRNWTARWFIDRLMSNIEYFLYFLWSRFQTFDLAIAMKENRCMREVHKLHAKKKVAWIQTDYRYYHLSNWAFESPEAELKCMADFQHVICVSESAREGVIQTIGNPGNLAVCYNPIDYKSIRMLAKQLILLEKLLDRPLFVSVGRLDAHKQYTMLIEICSTLEKKYDFELWILGSGPQEQLLNHLIRELDVHAVKLLGFCENPYPYLKQADCSISSSVSESYGLAIQESLILGVPVSATRCPAIEECMDTRFGIICDNSFEGLKSAMEDVLQHPDCLEQYRDIIAESYSVDNLYEDRLNAAYELIES